MSDIYDINRSLCSEFGMILFCKFHPTDPVKLKGSFVHFAGMANVEVAMTSYSFNYRLTDLHIYTKASPH